MYKNIEKQTKLQLKDLVEYQPGQVISKTLVQNEKVSMTIFSFDKGEEISTHGNCAGGNRKIYRWGRGVRAAGWRDPDYAERHSPCCFRTGTL